MLRVLEPGNSRSGCQHDGVRALFQVTHFFLYPHVVERARELWNISFVKSLIPFIKVPLHDLVFQKPRLLTPLYWVLGFQYINFERVQTFTIAPAFFFCISLIFYILVLNKWCFLTDRIFPSLPSLLTPLPPPIKAASCFELSASLEKCHKVRKSNQKCLPVFGLKNPKVPWGNIISESNSFPWVTKGKTSPPKPVLKMERENEEMREVMGMNNKMAAAKGSCSQEWGLSDGRALWEVFSNVWGLPEHGVCVLVIQRTQLPFPLKSSENFAGWCPSGVLLPILEQAFVQNQPLSNYMLWIILSFPQFSSIREEWVLEDLSQIGEWKSWQALAQCL